MTIRLFNKIAASLNHRLYPLPEPPTDPGHHVPVQAGEVLLDSGNEGGLCGMGASIGVFFKLAPGTKVHLSPLRSGLLGGRPHFLRVMSNCRIRIRPSFKLPFNTVALIWATVKLIHTTF